MNLVHGSDSDFAETIENFMQFYANFKFSMLKIFTYKQK